MGRKLDKDDAFLRLMQWRDIRCFTQVSGFPDQDRVIGRGVASVASLGALFVYQ